MTKVKICGITNLEDARVAVDAGADAIGFVFAESPRRISPETASVIVRTLPATSCVPVGVFVDEDIGRMTEIMKVVGLGVVQLHGSEPPETVEKMHSLGFDVVKSFRVSGGESSLDRLREYRPTAFLLDAYVAGKPGGTGRTFDWKLAAAASRLIGTGRLILAGGLGVDNVREAIEAVAPYGVDASSRLERTPGLKDHELVREFIRLVKGEAPAGSAARVPWPR